MDILIITTFYPPDTTIAAVRPYMFAKYLAERGHHVTVLRSGEFYNMPSDYFNMDIPVRVISYLGEDSPAERYARGVRENFQTTAWESRISFLPERIRSPISKVYNFFMRSRNLEKRIAEIAYKFEKQKTALDALKNEHFDVVFSTFGQEENIAAGQYAAKLFGCKLVQDFRDAVATKARQKGKQFRYYKNLHNEAVRNADGCTAVSDGLLQELLDGLDTVPPGMVLYNGFEPITDVSGEENAEPGVLSICYTGSVYSELQDFTPLLRALRKLGEEKRLDLDKVKLHYAGKDFSLLYEAAKRSGVENILEDHGYVSRTEAARIQSMSDLFLVLSWNMKESQGILTGKFFEGIRAKKPMLSVINGSLPNSELNMLNEKYHYGFCYESCREKEQFGALCDYLAKAYDEKMKLGKVQYEMNPELETRFRYDALAEQLEHFIEQL